MKRIAVVMVPLLCLCAIILFFALRDSRAPVNSSIAEPNVEELQALPYIQWSEEKADQKHSAVTIYDRNRAVIGYNLYTNDVDEAYLMDMNGRRLHTWRLGKGKKKCEYAVLLPNRELISVCMGQGIVKVNSASNILWKLQLFVHHDIEPLADGSYFSIARERALEYKSRFVIFDSIIRISPDGSVINKWSTFQNLSTLKKFHQPLTLDIPAKKTDPKKYDYYHLNTVKLLPETSLGKTDSRFRAGNLLICLRNVNLIAILDQKTWKVVWSWGPGELEWPHMPVMLPVGNIIIFDNGVKRKYSRVLELNPVTEKIIWKYEGKPLKSFFSGIQGSAQRLSGGNTLICESMRGHAFEVDRDGKIVWEFWNPDIKKGKRKTIYRLMRVEKDLYAIP